MKNRPLGVSILSVLSIVGGVLLLIVQLFRYKDLLSASGVTGISGKAALLNFILLGLWAFLSGIGMWTGKKWGWWLGATYFSYSVIRNMNVLLAINDLAVQHSATGVEVIKYYIKHTGRIIVHSLIVCYFFKKSVLEYFGFSTERRFRRVLKYLGVSVFISFIIFMVNQAL